MNTPTLPRLYRPASFTATDLVSSSGSEMMIAGERFIVVEATMKKAKDDTGAQEIEYTVRVRRLE